jgi:outer membrane receptor for ferrienterochelin and colicins
MKFSFFKGLFVLLSLGTTSVSAQDENNIKDLKGLLALDFSELMDVEIVVQSASKYGQDSGAAPAAVSVLTADEVRTYGYRTLGDWLSSVRGFHTGNDGIYPHLGVRGFARPGDYGTRILLLIDGHKVNDNMFGTSMDVPANLDLNSIERIEIVHGPSSSLYGAGAFLAIVNVFTKNPSRYKNSELGIAVDSENTNTIRALYSKSWENGAEMLLSASQSENPGEDVYIAAFDQGEDHQGITHNRNAEDVKRLFGKFKYHDFTLTTSYIQRRNAYEIPLYYSVFDTPNTVEDMRAYTALHYKKQLTHDFGMDFNLSYNQTDYKGHTYLAGETGLPAGVENRSTFSGRAWNGAWQWHWTLGKHRFTGGLEYQANVRQEMRNEDVYPIYQSLVYHEAGDHYRAAYVQDEYNLTDKVIVSAGLRYDDYDGLGSTINPRLAVIYRPTQNLSVKGIIARAFRAPSVYEKYYEDGYLLKRNLSGLEAETIQAYEMIVEYRVTSWLRGELSLYNYKVKDLVEFNLDPEDNIPFYDNLGQAKARGLEFQLQKHWENKAEMRLGYAWQDVRDDYDNTRLSGSPPYLLKWRGSYPLYKQWRVAGEIRHVASSRSHHDIAVHLPAYTVAHLTLSGELEKNWQVGLGIYNLFDKKYAYPISSDFPIDRYPGEARMLYLKLGYVFD